MTTSDIVERLRRWPIEVDAEPACELMDDAAAELKRLRWRVKTLESAAKYAARARPTLTDEEREAVERGYCALTGVEDMSVECTRWDAEAAATLRRLLERLK